MCVKPGEPPFQALRKPQLVVSGQYGRVELLRRATTPVGGDTNGRQHPISLRSTLTLLVGPVTPESKGLVESVGGSRDPKTGNPGSDVAGLRRRGSTAGDGDVRELDASDNE